MANDAPDVAGNIKSLVAISERIPTLLYSASSAITLLTNSPQSHAVLAAKPLAGDSEEGSDGEGEGEEEATANGSEMDRRKAAFLRHVRGYFGTLRDMEMALMKQVAALEDAGIVARDTSAAAAAAATAGGSAAGGDAPLRPPAPAADGGPGGDGASSGALGALDIAWLNSRGRDVGLEKERELVTEAKARLGRAEQPGESMEVVEEVPVKEEAMDLST